MEFQGPAALIVNGRSRRGRAWFETAQRELESAGISLLRVVVVGRGVSMEREVAHAIEEGCEAILVGGGDGTLRLAAKELIGSNRTLGVLPFGTGNAFARDLGIATSVEAAIEVIRKGATTRVDVGKAGDEVFLNVASVGLSTLVAARLRRMPKAVLGPFAYVLPVLQSIRIVRPFRVHLKFPTHEEEMSVFQVVVGNGRYHAGPFPLSEDASLGTGQFAIYAVGAKSRGALFRYFCGLMLGRQNALDDVHAWKASEVQLETRPSKRLVLDGEILGRTPARLQVIPRGLRVFTPESDHNSNAATSKG